MMRQKLRLIGLFPVSTGAVMGSIRPGSEKRVTNFRYSLFRTTPCTAGGALLVHCATRDATAPSRFQKTGQRAHEEKKQFKPYYRCAFMAAESSA